MKTTSRIATVNGVRATVVAALISAAFAAGTVGTVGAASFMHTPAVRTSVTADGFGWESAPVSNTGFGWE